MLIKIQPDATVCRYLFTAKSLYMFRVSHHPSSGVVKSVNAASRTGHNTGTATSLQRGLIGPRWREIKFRLTNVIPERIIFVSRGITLLGFPSRCVNVMRRFNGPSDITVSGQCSYFATINYATCFDPMRAIIRIYSDTSAKEDNSFRNHIR